MKVLTTHELHYLEYKNKFYDSRNYTNELYGDLLEVFDKVVLVARCKKSRTQPQCQQINENKIELFPVCDFSGYTGFIGAIKAFWQCRKAVGLADRYWLRAPGFTASMVAFWLKRKRFFFYLDMVGDPADVTRIKSQWLPSKISEVFVKLVKSRFRKLAAASKGVLAVTESTLQRLYPSSIPANDFGASDVRLPDEIFKQLNRNFNDEEFRIIIVGVLLKYKGHSYLLKSLSKIQSQRRWSLLVVGQGPELENLKRLAQELKIDDRVCLCGRIDWGSKLFEKLDKSHLFVLSSLTEGMPKVVIEAMACGLPVIATDVGGVHEILEPKFLIPTKNAEVLAEKISSLWKEPDELKRVSKRNFEKAKEFSLSRTQMLRRAWFRWMKECGDRPEEKRWSEFAKDKLSKDLTN